MPHPRSHRRQAAIRGAALLAVLTATGCSAFDHTSLGNVTFTTPSAAVVTIQNPLIEGCHSFGPEGARSVVNHTQADFILYQDPNCQQPPGTQTFYLATTTSDIYVPSQAPWRSFAAVGRG